MKRINGRVIEIINILAAGGPMTSGQITRTRPELTQSTVQAVLQAGYVEAAGVTHSGTVLSRTFTVTPAARAALLDDLVEHCRSISAAVSVDEAVAALQALGQKGGSDV
ncbi:MAG: hypothetical protein OSJ71_06545 [Acetatifactor sp.]|nr:hypothetical protein [Acetatifactor sp.]